MNATNRFPIVVRALVLMGVVGSCRHEESELTSWVQNYCTQLDQDLEHAAEVQRKLAPAVDEKAPAGVNQGSSGDLLLVSVGATPDARWARTQDLGSRFLFCVSVHRLDDRKVSDLEVRLNAIRSGLYADGTGQLPSAAKTAELLDQFHGLAHEVNQAPLKR